MFVVKANQNSAFMPTRDPVPDAERHAVYWSIVQDLKTNSKARQQIISEREFPTTFCDLEPGVSYSIGKEELESLLYVFEAAMHPDQPIPDDLRRVFRMLTETVDELNKDCVVYNSRGVFWLR
jgi:hypothetical protein